MKKIILILSMLTTVAITYSQAPNTWVKKADFGGGARDGAVGFSIGSKGYVGTGTYYDESIDSTFKDFWEYDPATNTWAQKADFGGGARWGAVGLSIGSKGYIGTGYYGIFLKDFWEYDPATNIWKRKADFGGTAREYAVGFNVGSKGYLGTGYSYDGAFHNYKDCWEYNPTANTWTQKADFGGAGRYLAVGFSIGSKGYLGTGYSYDESGIPNYYKDFWEYDPATNTWAQKSDFGGAGRYLAVGFSIGSRGYLGTGFEDASWKKDFKEYDPTANTWTPKANFGGTFRSGAVGFNIGSKGYLGTGRNNYLNNSVFFKDFWEYTPDGCNGLTVYTDADADGYGDIANSLFVADCIVPNGYVLDSTDCNDANAAVHPNAIEIIGDGIDNNCNGKVDENVNNALNFDGVNDYVSISNEQKFDFTGPFTIEAWINVTSFTKTWQAIVTKGDDSWRLHRGSNTNTIAFGTTGLSNTDVFGTTNINDGIWHHVAAVYDGSTKYVYVDGKLDGSIAVTGTIPNSNYSVAIGENLMAPGRQFNGNIDEVRIWNIARSPADINAHMNTSLAGNEPGLVAYYPFNQGIAGGNNAGVTTLHDITADNNDGTLNGFALNGDKSNWVAGVSLCPAPTKLRVPKISDTCARLNWSIPNSSVEHIKISYRQLGTSTWIEERKKAGENAIIICGLTPNTTYEWKARNICAGDKTPWVQGPNFTTLPSASFSSISATVNGVKVQGNVSIQIMPNPNKGSFTLQMQLPAKAATTTLSLYNNLGAKVWQQDAGILSGYISRNIALENKLSAGVYVMMIQHGDTRMMQKVFVVK